MELDPRNRPFNPFINSGAIAIAMQLAGDMHVRYESFRQLMSGFCNREVRLDEEIYKCESATGARNRAIADKLSAHGICNNQYDHEHGLVRENSRPRPCSPYTLCRATLLTRTPRVAGGLLHDVLDVAQYGRPCHAGCYLRKPWCQPPEQKASH